MSIKVSPHTSVAELAHEYLTAAYKEIRATFPPPYEYPSDDQNAAQIIADALDEVTTILKNKM